MLPIHSPRSIDCSRVSDSSRNWLLHSPLPRNEVAALLGPISFENEWTARVEYLVEGRQKRDEFAVHVRPGGGFFDSELLGELETTHNVYAHVHWEEDEAIFGRIHAKATVDLIEHPAVIAGVYCDTNLCSYLVWGERVELLSQDMFAKPLDSNQEAYIRGGLCCL